MKPTAHTLPHAPSFPPTLWIMVVPVINTRHLPQVTYDNLAVLFTEGDMVPSGYLRPGVGKLIRLNVDEVREAGITDPVLKKVFYYVMNRGYTHVRFDPDGEVLEDLEQFDW